MSIPAREFNRRLNRIMRRMEEDDLESLVIWSLEDIRYVSNYHPLLNESVLVLSNGREPVLVIDDEDDMVRAGTVTQLAEVNLATDLGTEISETLRGARRGRIGVAGWNRFPVPAYLTMKKRLRGEILQTRIVEELRRTKSPGEVALLQKAARITDVGMEAAVETSKRKKTELEMAAAGEGAMRAEGAETLSFPTNIGTGERANLISPLPSSRRPKDGDLVLIDLGGRYQGYCGDLSRTKKVGGVGSAQKDLFDAVLQIHGEAIKTIRPGIKTSNIHEVASRVAREAGYGRFYHFMTGHSIGLGEHERPYLYHDDADLEASMVVTIEPGMYVPKVGGVRIEDVVLVTGSGSRLLTSAGRGLD